MHSRSGPAHGAHRRAGRALAERLSAPEPPQRALRAGGVAGAVGAGRPAEQLSAARAACNSQRAVLDIVTGVTHLGSGVSVPGRGLSETGLVGIGCDLVDIDRFRRVIQRQPSVSERLFTEGELAYAGRSADPSYRLAARFAAKEATLKALGLGLGGMRMSEIEVVRDAGGRPGLLLHDQAGVTACAHGVGGWLLTLSHTGGLAQATVVALAQ